MDNVLEALYLGACAIIFCIAVTVLTIAADEISDIGNKVLHNDRCLEVIDIG